MPRYDGLETFVEVVNSGSFSTAADKLNVSKSHVSKQIARLEDRLGARLLNRTTRTVKLTDVGSGYYSRCAQILADL
jgi:DNA-binding transcriptional LysR family regulator